MPAKHMTPTKGPGRTAPRQAFPCPYSEKSPAHLLEVGLNVNIHILSKPKGGTLLSSGRKERIVWAPLLQACVCVWVHGLADVYNMPCQEKRMADRRGEEKRRLFLGVFFSGIISAR